MTKLRQASCAALLVASLLMQTACSTSASDDKPILALGDIQDDIKLGRQQHELILQEYGGAYDDPELAAYVSDIGNRLKNVSEYKDIDFTFTVLDSDIVNAFALPGGYVYVSRGLLALAQDEAELAGVIGHEIGHVTSRHGASRQTAGTLGGLVGVLGAIGGAILGGEAGARVGAQLGQVVGVGGLAQYSQSQEFEADKLGVRYLARAGYDPVAMADFLKALETNSKLMNKMSGGEGVAADRDFFASHPYTPDRVDRALNRAKERGAPANPIRERERLVAATEGMLYGQSPKQGYILGRKFAHPELGFSFEVPEGYRLQNSPSAVFASAENKLIRFDTGARKGGETLAQHLDKWVEEVRLSDRSSVRLDRGLAGEIGYGDVPLEQGKAEGAMAVVGTPSGDIAYRFLMLAKQIGRSENNEFLDVVDSMSLLTSSEIAQLAPRRIDYIRVQAGDTIDKLARRMEVDDFQRDLFIGINALDRGRELRAGELARIVIWDKKSS